VTALEHPPLFPDFPPPNFSMFPRLKVFWKDNDWRMPRKSQQKRRKQWQSYRQMFSRSAFKVLRTVAKCHIIPWIESFSK
jgi:hypothetical protein